MVSAPISQASNSTIEILPFDYLRTLIDLLNFSGGYIVGVTPVPIPNTEVKSYGADGTAWETVWESRSLPGLISEKAC